MNERSSHRRRPLVATFAYALEGLRYALRTQPTFRVLLVIAAMVAILVFGLRLSNAHAAIVMLAMALVIAAELFNTGIEAVVDLLVEQNHHSAAKVAKDISAGSVLTTSVAAAVVGILVLGPPLARAVGLAPGLAFAIPRWGAVVLLVAGAVGLVRLLTRTSSREAGRLFGNRNREAEGGPKAPTGNRTTSE